MKPSPKQQQQLAAIVLCDIIREFTEADAVQLQRFREHIVRQLDDNGVPTAFGFFRGPDKIVKTALQRSKIDDIKLTDNNTITIMFDTDEKITYYHNGKWDTR